MANRRRNYCARILNASAMLHVLHFCSMMTVGVAFQQPAHTLSRSWRLSQRHDPSFVRTSPLMAIAEFEELQRHRKDETDGDAENSTDEWIPTASGGFLPNWLQIRNNKLPSHDSQTLASPELMTEVSTLQDYKRVVADERDQLVVVLFYAPWCRACKATQPLFRKLARDYQAPSMGVKFVRVPLTRTNGFLHDGLGVPSLPYAHIYHPTAGLVEERKINKHVFEDFRGVLQDYVSGECEINWEVGVIRNSDDDDKPKKSRK